MASASIAYKQLSGLSSAKTLANATGAGGAIPTHATEALIQAESQDVRWTDDGTTPTASTGMLLTAGDSLYYDRGPLSGLKFIEASASALLNVTYYGNP